MLRKKTPAFMSFSLFRPRTAQVTGQFQLFRQPNWGPRAIDQSIDRLAAKSANKRKERQR